MKNNSTSLFTNKNIILVNIISLSFLFNSCTIEKRFGYREKIKVDKQSIIVEQNKISTNNDEIITASNSPIILIDIVNKDNQENTANSNCLKAKIETPNVKKNEKVLLGKPTNQIENSVTHSFLVRDKIVSPSKVYKLKDNDGKSTNGMALAGFICALAGLFIAAILLGPLGIIFSAIGLVSILNNQEKYKGLGFAIAGLIVGIIDTIIILAVISTL